MSEHVTVTIECYRRQLARAQAEVERLRREREVLAEALKAVQERNKHVYAALDHLRGVAGD